jgi:hypothetical protein
MVGDWHEGTHSEVWLWWTVVRVFVSFLWKDVVAHPGTTLYLVIAGALMQACFFLPFATGVFLLAAGAGWFGHVLHVNVTSPPDSIFAVPLIVSLVVPAPFLTGRWLARRSPGHELAPCVALGALKALVVAVGCLVAGNDIALMSVVRGPGPTLTCVVAALAMLQYGAIWARNHPSETRWFERFPFDHLFLSDRPPSLWSAGREAFRPHEQRVIDCFLLGLLVPWYVAGKVGGVGSTLYGILTALLSLVMAGNAGFGRPFRWTNRGSLGFRLSLAVLRAIGIVTFAIAGFYLFSAGLMPLSL